MAPGVQRSSAGRADKLINVLAHGPEWEVPTNILVARVSNKFSKNRVGVKAAKRAETLNNTAEVLNEEEATGFRALAARANYLALDRPDVAFATQELCREFAQPTRRAVEKLKKLVRYLKHHPRLVWRFKFEDEPKFLDTCGH